MGLFSKKTCVLGGKEGRDPGPRVCSAQEGSRTIQS